MDQSASSSDEIDFGSFLASVRDFERDASEVRTTAHSSSVTTTDWQRIEAALER